MTKTLHGLWLPTTLASVDQPGRLALWAESSPPRRAVAPFEHPQTLDALHLDQLLASLRLYRSNAYRQKLHTLTLALPSTADGPLPSDSTPVTASRGRRLPAVTLQPWRVEVVVVPPSQVLPLLLQLPEADTAFLAVGADLRFWQQVARLTAVALVRGQFVPTANAAGRGRWHVALMEVELQTLAARLARAMPPAARALAQPMPDPGELLNDFIETVGGQVAADGYSPAQTPFQRSYDYRNPPRLRPADWWWLDLFPRTNVYLTHNTHFDAQAQAAFGELARAWATPLRAYLLSPWRTAFRLEPPPAAETVDPEAADWRLSFHLQPKDQPETLWAASEVWENPPDPGMPNILREGLLQAAATYPRLAALHEAAPTQPTGVWLKVAEAVEFLEQHSAVLSQRGFGVLVPSWWKDRARKLNARVALQQWSEGSGLLGMNALVDFNWELAIGDTTLSPEEFLKLAQSKTALVQVRGEWLQLDPAEVQAALKLAQRYQKTKGKLTLREALGLTLTGPTEWEGLEVESVRVDGWLTEMARRLTGHQPMEAVPQPPGFVGQLRPYQLNGLAWLNFMRRYGFGACLADDMGLGKCVLPDTLVYVNGALQTAEELWETQAVEEVFDGEGFWTKPRDRLRVNAIGADTGRMTLATVRHMYRQRVKERVRHIYLEDGSRISLTLRHQLFTRAGWTNQFRAGDWVGVPAKLLWPGQTEDADLVTFLAWQIAEGHELNGRSTLAISQKDSAWLAELLQILQRVASRYHLKINQPAIRHSAGKVPTLVISSRAYQDFLAAKGYQWGQHSREKSIPAFIMQGDLEVARLFLRHYFDAEGSVSPRMRSVEISTASPVLMQQLVALLRRFGIWLRVSVKRKCATNGSRVYRDYHQGVLGGNSARRFLREIGFGRPDKQHRLEVICKRTSNTNVEGLPASDWVAEIANTTGLPVRHLGVNPVYLTGQQQFSAASLARVLAGIDLVLNGPAEAQYRQLKKSKWTTQTLPAYADLDRSQLAAARQKLSGLLEREVFYCRIKRIEETDYEGWVYDFEVDDHHNFVANHILCHNTIQILALLQSDLDAQRLTRPTLLICPTTVVNNWVKEAEHFSPQLRVYAHHGPARFKGEAFIKEIAGYHLIVTSYALLPRDFEFINQVQWGGVVLDEAHNIKNPMTKQAHAARQLTAEQRFALTGTPVENRLQDLWSILQFLNPGYLGSAETFQKSFAGPIERGTDPRAAARLRALTQPFILRRLKTDRSIIQDLPPKNEMKEYCGLTKEQAALYKAVVQESLRRIAAAEGIQRRGIILATLTKLKQVCNHPRHLLGDHSALKHRSGKLNRLTEMLEQALAEEDRCLIFTQYAEMGELLREHLAATFGEALYLHGGTPAHKRAEMISHFQDSGPRLFVLSLKAGGAGINLTRANRVFHFDRWWNPAVENQATDRAFRIGQTRSVQVHKLICRGTLEERVDELITLKTTLAEEIVGSGEGWLTELSTAELRDLLVLRREAIDD